MVRVRISVRVRSFVWVRVRVRVRARVKVRVWVRVRVMSFVYPSGLRLGVLCGLGGVWLRLGCVPIRGKVMVRVREYDFNFGEGKG